MVTPTKISILYPDAAKDEGIPEKDIEDIVVGSYKIMRANLSAGVHIRQRMPGLGAFVVKVKEVKKHFPIITRMNEAVKNRADWMRESVAEQFAFITRLQTFLDNEAKRKIEHNTIKFEYNKKKREEQNQIHNELNGKVANFMEEQEPDC